MRGRYLIDIRRLALPVVLPALLAVGCLGSKPTAPVTNTSDGGTAPGGKSDSPKDGGASVVTSDLGRVLTYDLSTPGATVDFSTGVTFGASDGGVVVDLAPPAGNGNGLVDAGVDGGKVKKPKKL